MRTDPPTLPSSCEPFARAVAAVAASHGIESFEMTFKPDWGDDFSSRFSIHGDLKINYRQKDGRGRPSENLNISMTANISVPVITNSDTF